MGMQDQAIVQWASAPRFPNYEVSDEGQVYSKKSRLILKPAISEKGYKRLFLYAKGGGVNVLVHRLVCEAFLGPCPDGQEVCHINGDPADNRLSNLRYGTRKSNMRDQYLHGTRVMGSKHPLALFTPEDIKTIHQLRISGCTLINIAQKYNTSCSVIWDIVSGRSYRVESAL